MLKVSSEEFQRSFGRYRTDAHREAVIITYQGREDLALLAVDEYKRLKAALDTRQALYPHELDDEWKARLDEGFQGEDTPELDKYLEDAETGDRDSTHNKTHNKVQKKKPREVNTS